MATKLVLDFKDADGATRRWNFNYADSDVTSSQVISLMDGMIANGSIFINPPISKYAAKLVITTETPLSIE